MQLQPISQTSKPQKQINTKPIVIKLEGNAGKRAILNTARRIMREHNKEIKALADK